MAMRKRPPPAPLRSIVSAPSAANPAEARARHAVFAFRRLVWVRGGPDRDVLRLGSPGSLRLIGILVRHVPGEQRASILFHVNLFLELASVKLHVFVRVPRVAILAGKLAPAEGIDGPFKRYALGITPV